MDKIISVARYIFERYQQESGEVIDEMKLHKLLYFAQRESLAITNEPMFEGEFEGWKYGPVCRELRAVYTVDGIVDAPLDITGSSKYIANNVISQYGGLATWKLSKLSHQETSWINSRRGLHADEVGRVKLTLEDIRKDAEKVRPYDSVWDMYYDEFDDCELKSCELCGEALNALEEHYRHCARID